MSTPERAKTRISPRWIVGAAVVGVLVIAGAWRVSDWTAPLAFWSSVLVNVGTSVMLAGFIYALERRFVRTTREAVREAATEAAVVAASEVDKRTEDLSSRIDSIRERVEAQRAEKAQHEDDVMQNLDGTISWRALWDAMEAAKKTGAIQQGVEVLAGLTPDAPIIEITASGAFKNEQWTFPTP